MRFLIVAVAVWAAAGCARQKPAEQAEAPLPEGPLRYEIAVGTEGFTPASVRARKGETVTLVFTRTTEETCGTEVLVPSYGLRAALPLHQPVEVAVRADTTGEIVFGCGMDLMLSGKIRVE